MDCSGGCVESESEHGSGRSSATRRTACSGRLFIEWCCRQEVVHARFAGLDRDQAEASLHARRSEMSCITVRN